jgi:hypothetical protein
VQGCAQGDGTERTALGRQFVVMMFGVCLH